MYAWCESSKGGGLREEGPACGLEKVKKWSAFDKTIRVLTAIEKIPVINDCEKLLWREKGPLGDFTCVVVLTVIDQSSDKRLS